MRGKTSSAEYVDIIIFFGSLENFSLNEYTMPSSECIVCKYKYNWMLIAHLAFILEMLSLRQYLKKKKNELTTIK